MQRKLFFLIIGLFGFLSSQAQSISYYPFNSQLALSSDTQKSAFAEVRVQMNSATSLFTTEIGPMIRLKKYDQGFLYLGGGASINWFNNVISDGNTVKGFYGSLGARAYPFEKLPSLGINFEFSPYTDSKVQTGLLRAWLGISYQIVRKK